MPKYVIAVSWAMADEIEVEADSLEEAYRSQKVEDWDLDGSNTKYYIDSSFEINEEVSEYLSKLEEEKNKNEC